MYSFFVTVHARPNDTTSSEPIELAGQTYQALRVSGDQLSTSTFGCTFEVARDRLGKLERMFCEPDGSFVWVSRQGEPAWQIDGNLYDRGEQLLFVDLKGTCPAEEFDRLLKALGWPETRLLFQLTREAIFLDEAEFRRYASRTRRS